MNGPRTARANLRAIRRLLTEPRGTLDELSEAYGRTFALRLGPARIVVVGDVAGVEEVLRREIDAYRWGLAFRNLAVVTGRTSMIVSDGDEHRRRRRLSQPALSRRRLDAWTPMIVREIDAAIDGLPPGEICDLYALAVRIVRTTVLRGLFGDELASRSDEIGDALEPALDYARQPVLRQAPHPFPVGRRAGARRARRRVDAMLDAEIARRRAAGGDRGDVLDGFLQAEGLRDEEIRDQIVTLVAAGSDTTSSAIGWMLAHAVRASGVWGRLRADADAGFADGIDERASHRFGYAAAVVQEALRLEPPGPFAPRETMVRMTIGGEPIRRHTVVAWSPYLAGRDPAAWTDPLQFRPARFVEGGATPPRYAWVPFGAGPRTCVGAQLAQLQMTLAAARIAQRVDAEPVGDMPVPEGLVVSVPTGGVPARITAVRPAG